MLRLVIDKGRLSSHKEELEPTKRPAPVATVMMLSKEGGNDHFLNLLVT